MFDDHDSHDWSFMTNTPDANLPALREVQKRFPGAITVKLIAYSGDGKELPGYVAVHTGPRPLVDYGAVWAHFDKYKATTP